MLVLNPEISANRRAVDRLGKSPFLASLADALQPAVRQVLERAGSGVSDLLHGTPLGHPLHPVITDVPVGAWTVTAVLDALELGGRRDVAFAADAALVVGLLGGLGAIASGLADWSDTGDEAKNVGMAHALLNSLSFSGYVASLALRRGGRRKAGGVTALLAYGVSGLAAYLGGELSFGLQLGMRHTGGPIDPPDDFTPVMSAAALTARPARAELNGIPVLVSRTESGVAAISAICTHRGGPLDQGTFADGCVTCPWHGSVFSLADGEVVRGPASFPQPRFEAREVGGRIELRALPV
jgi:nitrite reductase/ring-hydroxylating ferredoxin subunit